MTAPTDDDHGPGLRLSQSDVGAVSVCACGVVTLKLQYLSLRLEGDAFRTLAQMLGHAQARMDRHAGLRPTPGDPADDEAVALAAPLPRRVH